MGFTGYKLLTVLIIKKYSHASWKNLKYTKLCNRNIIHQRRHNFCPNTLQKSRKFLPYNLNLYKNKKRAKFEDLVNKRNYNGLPSIFKSIFFSRFHNYRVQEKIMYWKYFHHIFKFLCHYISCHPLLRKNKMHSLLLDLCSFQCTWAKLAGSMFVYMRAWLLPHTALDVDTHMY